MDFSMYDTNVASLKNSTQMYEIILILLPTQVQQWDNEVSGLSQKTGSTHPPLKSEFWHQGEF